ncbi:hypothetical protein GW17_00036186 [Ensete ventricosum]|nr:hypothetical protein GW17_00036186 [Ensete ventricosum]
MGASFHGDDWFVVGTLFPVVGEMRLLRPLAIASMCGFGVKTQRGAFFLFVHKLRRCWPTTHGGEKVDDGHVPLGDQLPQPSDGRHPTIRHWLQDFVTATQAQAKKKKKKKMMMHKHAPNPGISLRVIQVGDRFEAGSLGALYSYTMTEDLWGFVVGPNPGRASRERRCWCKGLWSTFPLAGKRTRVKLLEPKLGICMQVTWPGYSSGSTCDVRCSSDAGPS